MANYFNGTISEARRTDAPMYGRTADGYSKRSGAPSSYMVRLNGERRWRRVMVWQFSNAGTAFVRVNGTPMIIREGDLAAAVPSR